MLTISEFIDPIFFRKKELKIVIISTENNIYDVMHNQYWVN